MEETIEKKLLSIQCNLKAPKDQYNKFGKYSYRKLEGILDALKPLLEAAGLTLTISDVVKEAGPFQYIEAEAQLSDGTNYVTVTAQAGIEKAGGMQLPQAFGSASTYARKYAVSGLFLIDDSKDPDEQEPKQKAPDAKVNAIQKPSIDGKGQNLNPAVLIDRGWDETIKETEGDNPRPYIETEKAFVFLTSAQHIELLTYLKEMA